MRPRRQALCVLSVLLLTAAGQHPASAAAPQPLTSRPVALVATVAARSQQRLESIDASIALQVFGSSSDQRPDQVREAHLAGLGISTAEELRSVAQRVREAAWLLRSPTRAAAATRTLDFGQQVLAAIAPRRTTRTDASETAAVLEVAADASDLWKVRTERERQRAQGMLTGADAWSNRPSRLAHGDLRTLLLARQTALATRRGALVELAATVLVQAEWDDVGDAPFPSADVDAFALARTWETSGPRRLRALLSALERLGAPYQFGGRGPDAFDCSGLTAYAWDKAGVYLPTSSLSQREIARPTRRRLRPGDLVFWPSVRSRSGRLVGHVAIHLGAANLVVESQGSARRVRVAQFRPDEVLGYGRPRLIEEQQPVLHLPLPVGTPARK